LQQILPMLVGSHLSTQVTALAPLQAQMPVGVQLLQEVPGTCAKAEHPPQTLSVPWQTTAVPEQA
jgi:hypothetical protein